MAATPSSNTLRSFFSSTTSVMPSRPSASSIAGYSSIPNYSQGIGYSPSTPASPAASLGIPSFRSLRSLLSFGSNKNATTTSASSTDNLPRSTFGAFGSVRRSMTKDRERKVSLSNDAMMPPVIAIEKLVNDSSPDDTSGSVSFSKLDNPLPTEPSPCGDESVPSSSAHIKADNSGVSEPITADLSPNAANHNVQSTQGHNNTSPASRTSRLPRARYASSNPSSPSPQSPVHNTPPFLATSKPSSLIRGNSYNIPRPSTSPALPSTSNSLRDRDGGRTPSLRLVDTTTAVVRNRTSRIPKLPARMRKRSMSFQEKSGKGRNEDTVRSGSSLSTKTSSGGGVESGSSVNESSVSSGPKMELLGPRTAKAFRAAGLLDFDREVGSRIGSESFSAYGGASSPGDGSSYAHNGLMESPARTVSSGSRERDTPKSSVSTAPTSLADPFGYLGRDRSERDLDREREREREEMKEKHGNEMGALLGALSDSQRTVRVLREENSDLRDRLERFTVAIQASQELRRVYGDLQSECSGLRRENIDLKRELVRLRGSWSGGNSSGSRTPIPNSAVSGGSPLARTFTSRAAREGYDDTSIDRRSEEVEIHRHPDCLFHKGSSPVSSKKRRLSNSSSLFPIPPSDMTLLLHEDVTSTVLGYVGGDHSQHGFSIPPPTTSSFHDSTSTSRQKTTQSSLPISYANFVSNIPPNSSVTSSVGSISPSTADFSINTGSPGSLSLRPEHELLLGDMESLDLGVGNGDGDGESC